MIAKAKAPLASARPIGTSSESSPGAARIGINTRNGTTARSWNSNTPYCSLSNLVTTAVDDIASAPPTANAACQDSPNITPIARVLRVEITTWVRPMPRTMLRIAISRGIDTSRPIANSRKTTPISAICSIACESGINPKPRLPASSPTTR